MQSLGLHDKNPMMFEMVLKLSTRREGGNITFKEFTEDIADLIVSKDLHRMQWYAITTDCF